MKLIMCASKSFFRPFARLLSALVFAAISAAASAQSPARIDAPDGAPELAPEKTVSNVSVSTPPKAAASVIVEEERVQGRLANAHVRVGGSKGYTVVDPHAGRTDRQADNGGKRVSPSLWELFRF
jgi:hypothetical protein